MNHQVGGPQGPPSGQVSVDISQATDVLCVQCGRPHFMDALRMKRLSAILSPTGKEEMIKMETLLCMSCGWEMGMPLPPQGTEDEQGKEVQ
jgi:hypothetical protein